MQIRSLLSAALGLAHRKALFEYLRDRQVPTAGRQRRIVHFYGHNDYLQALLPYLKREILETRILLLARPLKR